MNFERITATHQDYLSDESRLQGEAEWIAFPQDTEQVAGLCKKAQAKDLPITLQGANTGIVGGSVPQGGAVINLREMNRVLGMEKNGNGDYLLIVQAGATLHQINKLLASPRAPANFDEKSANIYQEMMNEHPHMYAPNPTEDTATVGGLFATNASGANALRYGRVSDHVDWVEAVLSDGSITKITNDMLFEQEGAKIGDAVIRPTSAAVGGWVPADGGRLIDWLAGSEGRLMTFTTIALRLHKEPSFLWGVHYFFDAEGAYPFLEYLSTWSNQDKHNLLSAAEYYDANSLQLLRDSREDVSALQEIAPIPKGAMASVFVELVGEDEEVLEMALMEHLDTFIELGGKDEHTWAADTIGDVDKFHDLRHALPEVINMRVDHVRLKDPLFTKLACDFSAPKELLVHYGQMYEQDIEAAGLEGYVFGHALENHYHVNLLPADNKEQKTAAELIEKWADRIIKDGGCLLSENGMGRLKQGWVQRYYPKQMQQFLAYKEQLDSSLLLGPSMDV